MLSVKVLNAVGMNRYVMPFSLNGLALVLFQGRRQCGATRTLKVISVDEKHISNKPHTGVQFVLWFSVCSNATAKDVKVRAHVEACVC